jgi:type IV secretory pathway protease TraF
VKACLVRCAIFGVAAAALTGCTSGTVVNTDDAAAPPPTSTTAPPVQFGTANLVNAAEYAIEVDGRKGYYFSTPSGALAVRDPAPRPRRVPSRPVAPRR